jgi:hypothetical protein
MGGGKPRPYSGKAGVRLVPLNAGWYKDHLANKDWLKPGF